VRVAVRPLASGKGWSGFRRTEEITISGLEKKRKRRFQEISKQGMLTRPIWQINFLEQFIDILNER